MMRTLTYGISKMSVSENNNPDTGNLPVEPDLMNFLVSSIHDTKNSVCLLLSSLEKTLANTDASQLAAYAELVRVNAEAKRVNNNLVQLLTLYKVGQRVYPFDVQYVSLRDFIAGIVAQYSDLLQFRQITLEAHVDPELHWYFDEDLINAVVGNAINNAIRYTRDCIRIAAEEQNGQLLLRIEDNGRGYPVAMLQDSYDSMHRVDPLENSTGLGFYFSDKVARMHRNQGVSGKLKLENGGSMKGACFLLFLP